MMGEKCIYKMEMLSEKAKRNRLMKICIIAFLIMTVTFPVKVRAATAKNFKGNLNATYKGIVRDIFGKKSYDSKIIIKRVDNKKVKVEVIASGINQGAYKGTIISKDTIRLNLDGGEKVKLKWKDKTHFVAKRPSGGFSEESAQLVKLLCYSLNDVKYTQVKKPQNTSYFASCPDVKSFKKTNGKLIVTAKSNSPLKYETSTGIHYTKKISCKLAEKCKWSMSSPDGFYRVKSSYKELRRAVKTQGILHVLTIEVKNGKIVRVNVSSP